MDADANEVGERLAGVGGNFLCLWRVRSKYGRDVNGSVLEHGVRGADCAEVTTRAGVRNPRRWGDLAVLVDHRWGCVSGRSCRIEQWRRPIGKRHACSRGAVRLEVAERVRYGLAHPIWIDAG